MEKLWLARVAARQPSSVAAAPKHFGKLLRQLRRRTATTQEHLAKQAGVSKATIQQAEGKPECEWRPQTKSDVLVALNDLFPLTAEERQLYKHAAAMTDAELAVMERQIGPLQRTVESIEATYAHAAAAVGARTKEIASRPRPGADLHELLDAMLTDHGYHNVRDAMYAMAEAFGQSKQSLVKLKHPDGLTTMHAPQDHPPAKPVMKQHRRSS